MKQITGLLGSIALFIGVFLPLISVPIIGNINYFLNGKGDGVFILALAIISFISVIIRGFIVLWVTGIISFCIITFTFINFKTKMAAITMKTENPFMEMLDMAVQFQWGFAVLIAGSVLLITSAAIKEDKKESLDEIQKPIK